MKKVDLIIFWLKIIAGILALDVILRVFGALLVSLGH
jgi:hypothetical protein|nr:MAG TPA: Toxin TisB, type I toxin-antitoxin system [Microviridae sp.]